MLSSKVATNDEMAEHLFGPNNGVMENVLVAHILHIFPGAKIVNRREQLMLIDKSPREEAAIFAGAKRAGEYAERVFKDKEICDLASLTKDQWLTLIECGISGYIDYLQKNE